MRTEAVTRPPLAWWAAPGACSGRRSGQADAAGRAGMGVRSPQDAIDGAAEPQGVGAGGIGRTIVPASWGAW